MIESEPTLRICANVSPRRGMDRHLRYHCDHFGEASNRTSYNPFLRADEELVLGTSSAVRCSTIFKSRDCGGSWLFGLLCE